MARHRMGPFIERREDHNLDGIARRTGKSSVRREGMLGMLGTLDEAALRPSDGWDHSIYGLLHELRHELNELAMIGRLSADEIFDEVPIYRDYAYYSEHHLNWMPAYPMRILLDAKITSRGNLSVTFSPSCLDPSGQWAHAAEWIAIPFLGTADIMQRPNDEVLFVRGAERLFADRGRKALPCEDPFSVACRATNFAFWIIVERLSRRFEVHLARYVALLATDGATPDCLGLEMVDALREHRADVASSVDGFRRSTGHSPQAFWATCRDKGLHRGASKALRGGTVPSSSLTPSVVCHFHALLSRARDYGIWRPDEGEAMPHPPRARVPDRLWPPKSDLPVRSLGHGVGEVAAHPDPEPDPAARQPSRRPKPAKPSSASVVAPEAFGDNASARDGDGSDGRSGGPDPLPMPPDYGRLRRYAATPEELDGTGATDVDGLVQIVNDIVASAGGRGFVTQSDFPSSKANFRRLVTRLRRMIAARV